MAKFKFRVTPTVPTTGYAMPSVQDEKDTYALWGWSWTTPQDPANIVDPWDSGTYGPYTVVGSNVDVHDNTEGDDFWTYSQMYQRGGIGATYLTRANAWGSYFRTGLYRLGTGGASTETYPDDIALFGGDHTYGWGLLLDYEINGTVASLTEAELLAASIESLWNPATTVYACVAANGCTHFGVRLIGRHLLFMTRLYEITNALRGSSGTNVARWLTLLNTIIAMLLGSAEWNVTYEMYFVGEEQTDISYGLGVGAYDAGARVCSPFQIGVLSEAMFHAYRITGNATLRTRLIAMAEFVRDRGLDPTYQYSGSVFGIVGGQTWHNYSSNPPVTFWDQAYTISLVNLLVMGYKYTGDSTLLAQAKVFLNRGTKGVYGSPTARSAADNEVHHFMDTKFATATVNFYLDYNKGELQYTYLIFENGGLPTAVSNTALGTLADSLAAGEWGELTGTNLTSVSLDAAVNHVLGYADSANWDPISKQFMFLGGAHSPGVNQVFLVYDDATDTWRAETLPALAFICAAPNSGPTCIKHAYCQQAVDPVAGHLYFSDTDGPRDPNAAFVYRYDIATNDWGSGAYLTIPYRTNVGMGVAWFPDLGAQGSLFMCTGRDNSGYIYRWDKATATWSDLSGAGHRMGEYHNFAEYNPVTQKLLFGGGVAVTFPTDGKCIWEMNSSGTITQKANAPSGIESQYGVVSVDPVSGKFLVFQRDAGLIWALSRTDTAGENWSSTLTNPITTAMSGMDSATAITYGLVAAPVSTYNCTLFLLHGSGGGGGNSRVWIYKGGV